MPSCTAELIELTLQKVIFDVEILTQICLLAEDITDPHKFLNDLLCSPAQTIQVSLNYA